MLVDKLKRPANLVIALSLIAASVLPVIASQTVSAYGLLASRSIEMSSSKQADTNVIYKLGFTTATTNALAGLVVNFCDNSPIVGDSCNPPTGFDTVSASLALANQSGITGWSVDTTNSTANKLILTRASSSISNGVAASVDLGTAVNGITNPNTTNTTFYARILTYDTAAHAQAYNPTASGGGTGVIDAGGVALSTSNQITVTSKVQERLSFCIYTGINCAAGGNAVTLGDTNGVLDPSGEYVDKTTKYDVATNAGGNAVIRMKGDTLKAGSFDITAIGAAAASTNPGNEQFGFCTYASSGAGTLTPTAPYNNANCNTTTQTAGTGSTGGSGTAQFAFDTTNINTTYGQSIATKNPGTSSTGIIAFIGNISNTTEAAIYTTTLTFVATGTY